MGDFKFLSTSPAIVKIDNASIFELTDDDLLKSIKITAGNEDIILPVTYESTSPGNYSSNFIEYRIDGTNDGWIYINGSSINAYEFSLEEIESYIEELTSGNK